MKAISSVRYVVIGRLMRIKLEAESSELESGAYIQR